MNCLPLRYKRSPFTEHQSENECRQRHNPTDSICSRQRICQLLLGNTLRRDKIDHSSQRTILYHKIKRAAQIMHADPRKTLLAIAYHHTYPPPSSESTTPNRAITSRTSGKHARASFSHAPHNRAKKSSPCRLLYSSYSPDVG